MSNMHQQEVSTQTLIDLAIYTWRLETWSKQHQDIPSATVPRYVVRGLNKILEDCDVTVLDVTGNAFEAGLACDVLDSLEVDSVPAGNCVIAETIAPIVSIRGQVAKHGQIVLHVGKSNELTGAEK